MLQLNLRPTIIDTRASRYVNHVVPKVKPAPIQPMSVKEGIEMLQYMLSSLAEAENNYFEAKRRILASGNRPSMDDGLQLRKSRQAMNQLVSLKTKDMARLLGITESALLTRYLPKTMTGMWFCSDPNQPYETPLDFLRMLLCLLQKHGTLYGLQETK